MATLETKEKIVCSNSPATTVSTARDLLTEPTDLNQLRAQTAQQVVAVCGLPHVLAYLTAEYAAQVRIVFGQYSHGAGNARPGSHLIDQASCSLTAHFGAETGLVLKSPTLPAMPEVGDTVRISFDIDFKATSGAPVGRHGGIFWGAKGNEAASRWDGHRPLEEGAKVTNVDWIDRDGDLGYRIYGTGKAKEVWGTLRNETAAEKAKKRPNPATHWEIRLTRMLREGSRGSDGGVVLPDNDLAAKTFIMGEFWADGEFVEWFSAIDSTAVGGPHLGFWCYVGNTIQVSNLVVERIQRASEKAQMHFLDKQASAGSSS
eukprot:g64916.t1